MENMNPLDFSEFLWKESGSSTVVQDLVTSEALQTRTPDLVLPNSSELQKNRTNSRSAFKAGEEIASR